MKKKIWKNTYLEVMRHCSLGGLIASIRSEPIVLPGSHELTMIVPRHCHHPRVAETNQVT
jgi:hypothetical protein